MVDEVEAIERIRAFLPGPPVEEVWIGDDAAVVASPAGPLLMAADLVVAGVHADLDLVGLDDLGWKVLVANVSDMAAMGGRPERALVSVAGPPGTDVSEIYSGLAAAALHFGCPVVGGDLASAEVLVVSVAMTGMVPGGRPILRSGARAGEGVWATGPFGASAAGLRCLQASRAADAARHLGTAASVTSAVRGAPGATRGETPAGSESLAAPNQSLVLAHCRPRARVAEGQAAAAAGATAMIDVSDGLSLDLDRLARASGVGVSLWEVPVADQATLEDALGGGEDYELVFAAPDDRAVLASFAQAGLRAPLRIGTCTPDPTQRQVNGKPLEVMGWRHDLGWA